MIGSQRLPLHSKPGVRLVLAATGAFLLIPAALFAVEVGHEVSSVADAAPSDVARTAVDVATQQVGEPYAWGAKGPAAFDASGLVTFSYGRAGLSLPDGSFNQYRSLPAVQRDDAQPGDLIFANDGGCGRISTVAIFVSKEEVLRASSTAGRVMRTTVHWGSVVGVARPSPASTTLRGASPTTAGTPGRVRPEGCEVAVSEKGSQERATLPVHPGDGSTTVRSSEVPG